MSDKLCFKSYLPVAFTCMHMAYTMYVNKSEHVEKHR